MNKCEKEEEREPTGWIRNVYEMFPNIDRLPSYRDPSAFPDLRDDFFWKVVEKYKPYSLLGVARFWNIYESMQHIARAKIPGDVIECGVFLGGAIAAAIDMASALGVTQKTFWLSDTFEGFTKPASEKKISGEIVSFGRHPNFRHIVEKTLSLADRGQNKIELLPGAVEDTLPNWSGGPLALVRLDTDYYESTRVELEALYPKLSNGGVLIVDDYGEFDGVRRAVDEYFTVPGRVCAFSRVDYSCRTGVKLSGKSLDIAAVSKI
jgi:O-methyltransferase